MLFLRYRDLNQVWDLIVQAGFFVAPIIYPIAILPERFHVYLYLWPPTPVIQFARSVLVDGPGAVAGGASVSGDGGGRCSLVTGALVYRRLAPRAAEYL